MSSTTVCEQLLPRAMEMPHFAEHTTSSTLPQFLQLLSRSAPIWAVFLSVFPVPAPIWTVFLSVFPVPGAKD